MTAPLIEVHHLTKRFGDRAAVDRISFAAHQGEIVGLLGPNGAGKTTTMRMLTGFMPPTEGTARIAGHDIIQDSIAARRSVGYLPERVPVYPDMTVLGYVEYWARLRGARHARARAETVLKHVDLYDRRRMLVRHLSKGMRQRLGLAQALVHNPPVILLDEPTIGIDPEQVIEVRQMVRRLGQDHTVLFSTHLLFEAEQVCDRVLILNRGMIAAQGKPGELRQQIEGGASVYVEVGGASRAQVEAALRAIPGVTGVERQGAGYVVRARGAGDLRGAISDAVFAAGLRLLEMRQAVGTLEDVFLQIIHDERAARGEGER
jgi:ABC-2 type transport system ATP-binding protein